MALAPDNSVASEQQLVEGSVIEINMEESKMVLGDEVDKAEE